MSGNDHFGLILVGSLIANDLKYENRINAYISRGFNYDTAKQIVDGEYSRQAEIDAARPWGGFARFLLGCWTLFWGAMTLAGLFTDVLGFIISGLALGLGVTLHVLQARKRRRWNARWSGETQLVRY